MNWPWQKEKTNEHLQKLGEALDQAAPSNGIAPSRIEVPRVTEKAEKIFWEEEEIDIVVERWSELFAEEPLASTTKLLQQAIDEMLSVERRRKVANLPALGEAFNRKFKLKLAELKNRLRGSLVEKLPELKIITVQVPVEKNVSREEIFQSLTPGNLIGEGIDRLVKALQPTSREKILSTEEETLESPEVGPLSAVVEKPAIEHPKTRKTRILVIGLLPGQEGHLTEKTLTLKNVDIAFQEADRRVISQASWDYILVTRHTAHQSWEQARAALPKDRVLFITGGQSDLLQKISEINSKVNQK